MPLWCCCSDRAGVHDPNDPNEADPLLLENAPSQRTSSPLATTRQPAALHHDMDNSLSAPSIPSLPSFLRATSPSPGESTTSSILQQRGDNSNTRMERSFTAPQESLSNIFTTVDEQDQSGSRLPQSPSRKTAPISTHTVTHRQSTADTFKDAERRKSIRERSRSAYVSIEELAEYQNINLSEEEMIKKAQRLGLIQYIPVTIWDQTHTNKENQECSICMEDHMPGDEVRFLPCMHCFHSDCIADWLSRSFTCPLCMHDIPLSAFDHIFGTRPSNNNTSLDVP